MFLVPIYFSGHLNLEKALRKKLLAMLFHNPKESVVPSFHDLRFKEVAVSTVVHQMWHLTVLFMLQHTLANLYMLNKSSYSLILYMYIYIFFSKLVK